MTGAPEKKRPGTPGFWVNCGAFGAGYLVRSVTGAQVAVVYGESVTPEAKENLELIAGIPEMLIKISMCQDALRQIASGCAHPAAVAAAYLGSTDKL